MNLHKTCQLKVSPIKIIKLNADISAYFICLHSNCIDIGEFPQEFENANIMPVPKKKGKSDKLITNLSTYCKTSLKFTKN